MVSKHKQRKKTMNQLQVGVSMSVEDATEYLESVGEWHTIRNVPRDVMIRWAEYLKQHEISSNSGRTPKAGQSKKNSREQQVR
jgi:hypothetical protein